MKKLLLIIGILSFLAGFFLIMNSKPIGVVLLLVGIGLGVFYAALMLRAGGYRGEGAFFHGLNGQGRQQSEVMKGNYPQTQEQPANIWDKMTEDKI